jgi:hypothetical protein
MGNPGASAADLASLERWLGRAIPAPLRTLLAGQDGRCVTRERCHEIYLHAAAEIPERNDTYEVRQYLPGYLLIGVGSAQVFVIALDQDEHPVFAVGHGALFEDCLERVADGLTAWAAEGFRLPPEHDPPADVPVVLDGIGTASRPALMALLRRELGLDLAASRRLVDSAPVTLATRMPHLAARLVEALRAIGAEAH